MHTTYDAAGRVTAQSLDVATVATPAYDGAGELASVAYTNGSSLSSIARDPAGRTTSLTWTQPGGASLVTDVVVRSQSGRVVDEAVDGVDPHAGSNFAYDGAGRRTAAWVGSHAYTYSFATPGCGSSAKDGRNTNRTSMTDNAAPTTFCYDAADRLTSSSDPAAGAPAYDGHGNTTTLGTQNLGYDGADRHTRTVSGATTIPYTRDASDRIVSRTEAGTTIRYGYSGPVTARITPATP